MPRIKKFVGNYVEALEKSELPPVFASEGPYEELISTVIKDLNRSRFFANNGKTFDDLINTWFSDDVSRAYSQGNTDAAFFSLIFKNFMQRDPRFVNEKVHRKEADREVYANIDNQTNVSFPYFDDDGVPCGVSFNASKSDGSLWTATIIRNTPAAPEDREVMIIGSNELIGGDQYAVVEMPEAVNRFMQFLKSDEIKSALQNFLSPTGEINHEVLRKLDEMAPPLFSKHRDKLESLRVKFEPIKKTHERIKEVKLDELERLFPENYKRISEIAEIILANDDKIRLLIERSTKKKALVDKSATEYNVLDKTLTETKNKLREEQPFLRRNALSLASIGIGILGLVGLTLMLTGVLAPLGIALTVGIATYLGIAGASAAAALAVTGGIGLGVSEKKFSKKISDIDDPLRSKWSEYQALKKESDVIDAELKDIRAENVKLKEERKEINGHINAEKSKIEEAFSIDLKADCQSMGIFKDAPSPKASLTSSHSSSSDELESIGSDNLEDIGDLLEVAESAVAGSNDVYIPPHPQVAHVSLFGGKKSAVVPADKKSDPEDGVDVDLDQVHSALEKGVKAN